MKSIYCRKVGTFRGSLIILQVIAFNNVVSLSRNRSVSNGDLHGWRIGIKDRSVTEL